MRRTDFHFDLPDELIARYPSPARSGSRLLQLEGGTGALADRHFVDLPALLRAGDLLVFNDTRVIPARLHGIKRASGGKVEVMLERLTGPRTALVQLRASKPSRPGSVIDLGLADTATVVAREDDFWRVEFSSDAHEIFERLGEMPLPPYVERAAEAADRERYQTVYAREPGAVAAPTAGLHFDDELLQACRAAEVEFAYVTLHVGAGTFQPVRVDDVAQHRMHAELCVVPPATCAAVAATQARGGRVIAVGTTAVRALESAAAATGSPEPFMDETRLFITPGKRFNVIDAMVTNFHLPESTLLMLVSAFAGREQVLAAYRHAVAHSYRFFSYGDAMFIEPAPDALARENHQ
ncbi:MAG: tRNA preQ1(34) S-adenosylmethionine ribosyltransferase-isomerase QueA [Steroidobacteraceae bacterium]